MDKNKLYEYTLKAIIAKLNGNYKEFWKWANKAQAMDKQIHIDNMLHASVAEILKEKGCQFETNNL